VTLEPGTIVYFPQFYFPDGAPAKPKYFIYLCHGGPDMLVATLPTRTDRTPLGAVKAHGCIEANGAAFSSYYFQPGRPIATNGWFFPDPNPTYIYPRWVETYSERIFEDIYSVEGVDYQIMGRLTKAEYEALLACIVRSNDAKMKYKRLLDGQSYAG
jgi:hypothetical protein